MTRHDDEWDPARLPDLAGHRYLVTGGNRGLGYFACEQLVRAGARVVMTGRNPNRLASARAAVERRVRMDASAPMPAPGTSHVHPLGSVETLLLDTSNLGSVRAAAATARTGGRIDGVLLNAGVVHPPKRRELTVDGHEVVFATNALGHYALCGELLAGLAATRGRMVWVGSMATSISPYDPVDPELVDEYTPWRAYVQSKVETTALGLEADRRLRLAGLPIRSVVAHPGYSLSGRTPGIRGVNEPSLGGRFADNLQAWMAQSKEHGAWPLVRALVDPDVQGGEFWGPASVVKGAPRKATPSKLTRSPELGARLWDYCEQATRVRWPFERARRIAKG
ncbi:SDR family NAD(P)-dependent oxidoreductase [Microbacterium sp. ASV49]|uniref:SDR family NAD(P)-dependent oxidoreductase n=1 Tax=Microbacterium candidum TaxID=3041922 RepID=A0ABT7MYC9_9MICO|nr:SDR family NAD(P)-dependent oxidoreductase [Microbacterium sp. ASV49]MDL9979462.1 SDR family NAD(P)-dependent oxidoreductase [Microbacterium sp. ASV49]